MEDNRDERRKDEELINDKIMLYEKILKAARKKKENLTSYMEEIADIMRKLKTDEVKEELAIITQENYKKMLDLDISLAIAEKELETYRLIRGMFN